MSNKSYIPFYTPSFETFMNIVCATDNAYVPWCGVMLTSLRENHSNITVNVYILTEGLNTQNMRDLLSLETKQFFIHICKVDGNSVKDFPVRQGDHVSLAAYNRLFLASILPATVSKAVYLDCDIIITGDISDLKNIDCGECGIAAVSDEAAHTKEPYERLRFNQQLGYFNSGVLLVDLDTWRNQSYQQALVNYITEDIDRCKFHDQDALNGVFAGKWVKLPLKYNLQTGFILTHIYEHLPNKDEVQDAIKERKIIHFTGYSKPWNGGFKHPYFNLFLKYKNLSLWNEIEIPMCATPTFKERLYHIACKLGFKKQYKSYIVDNEA